MGIGNDLPIITPGNCLSANVIRDRLEDYKKDPDSAKDFNSAMDEIKKIIC